MHEDDLLWQALTAGNMEHLTATTNWIFTSAVRVGKHCLPDEFALHQQRRFNLHRKSTRIRA